MGILNPPMACGGDVESPLKPREAILSNHYHSYFCENGKKQYHVLAIAKSGDFESAL
jgi:hypothetical protein